MQLIGHGGKGCAKMHETKQSYHFFIFLMPLACERGSLTQDLHDTLVHVNKDTK